MTNFKIATKIVTGDDSINVLSEINDKRILLICDSFLSSCYNIEKIKEILSEGNIIQMFTDVKPDPTIHDVANGIKSVIEFNPDVMIAYGGGSAIDLSKAIRQLAKNKGVDVESLIAIPTTSGTGSEVTNASVISIPENKVKIPLFDDAMLPDIAILDPVQTLTVPSQVTANTGIDVLTHALEAIVSTNSDDFSDAMAEKSISLVIESLIGACENGDNVDLRRKMQHASCMAGIAFNHAGLGLNHAIAHQIGARFHVPHGLANAVILTNVIKFNSQCGIAANKYARISRNIGISTRENSTSECVSRLVIAVDSLCNKIGMKPDFDALIKKINNDENGIDSMSRSAMVDATLPTNPIQPKEADIKSILKSL